MDRLITREMKRTLLIRNCRHEFVEYIIRDPADRRYKLHPVASTVSNGKYIYLYCKHCGTGKFVE